MRIDITTCPGYALAGMAIKKTKLSSDKRSDNRSLLSIVIGAGIIGLILLLSAVAILALTPADGVDSRPRLIAALISPTPTATITSTPTTIPTTTPIPTATLSPEVAIPTVLPTETLIPTEIFTSTPLPTPDSRDREFVVPILMYHYTSVPPQDADIYRQDLSVTPDNFRQQMQWLKDNGYTPISLYHLTYALSIGWPPLPNRPIILTFDDGYRDNYENAFPILTEMGFIGTFFILTDITDQQSADYMTWDMLHEMKEAGMDIEVHGRTHIEYSGRDYDWLIFNLLGPVQTIEAELGYTPRFLAYVSGKYDDLTISVAQDAGYWAAVTTQHGVLHNKDNMMELKRVRIRGEWDLTQFSAVISGFY